METRLWVGGPCPWAGAGSFPPAAAGSEGTAGSEKNNSNLPFFAGFPKKWGCAVCGAGPHHPGPSPGALPVPRPCRVPRCGCVPALRERVEGAARTLTPPLNCTENELLKKPLKRFPLGSLSHLSQLWELPGPRGASPVSPPLTPGSQGTPLSPQPGAGAREPSSCPRHPWVSLPQLSPGDWEGSGCGSPRGAGPWGRGAGAWGASGAPVGERSTGGDAGAMTSSSEMAAQAPVTPAQPVNPSCPTVLPARSLGPCRSCPAEGTPPRPTRTDPAAPRVRGASSGFHENRTVTLFPGLPPAPGAVGPKGPRVGVSAQGVPKPSAVPHAGVLSVSGQDGGPGVGVWMARCSSPCGLGLVAPGVTGCLLEEEVGSQQHSPSGVTTFPTLG